MPISDVHQNVIDQLRNGEYPGAFFYIPSSADQETAAAMIDALRTNAKIVFFTNYTHGFDDACLIALANVLRTNTVLRSVSIKLDNPAFPTKMGMIALADALKNNVTLSSLDLAYASIDDEAAAALAEAIKSSTTLKEICFHYCKIAPKGVTALAEALKVNTSLETLNFTECKIGDKGIQVLSGALKTNTTLKNIFLSLSNVSDKGVNALVEILSVNTSIVCLKLIDFRMNAVHAKQLADALSKNHTIRELHFDGITMGDVDVTPLFEMLEKNTSIAHLAVYNYILKDSDMIALANALKINNTLDSLVIELPPSLSANVVISFLEAFYSNISLLSFRGAAFSEQFEEKVNRNKALISQALISKDLLRSLLVSPFNLDEKNTYESQIKAIYDEIKKMRAEHPEYKLPYRLLQIEHLYRVLTSEEKSNPDTYLHFLWQNLASYKFTTPTLQAIADNALASKLVADSSPSHERFVYGLWLSRSMLDYVCEHKGSDTGFQEPLKIFVMNHFSSTSDALNLDASEIMTYDYIRKLGYELLIDLKKSTEENSSQFRYLNALLRYNEYDADTAKRLVQFLQVTGKLSVPVMLLEDALVSKALVVHDFKKQTNLEDWALQEWKVFKEQPKPEAVLPAIIKDAKEKLNKTLTSSPSQAKSGLYAQSATPDKSTPEPNKPPTLT